MFVGSAGKQKMDGGLRCNAARFHSRVPTLDHARHDRAFRSMDVRFVFLFSSASHPMVELVSLHGRMGSFAKYS